MTKRENHAVSRLRFATRWLSTLAGLFLFALAAYGQNGSVTGTVSDPSGAAIASISVDVKNTETGVVFHGGTSATGNYVIPVPAGNYEVTVTATGFKKYVRPNVPVATASDTRLDVKLEVGAVSDTITVNEQAPLLKTESGEMAHTLSSKDVTDLPVLTVGGNIRNPLQQIVLLPGTTFQNENAVVVNGMPANSQSIRIEGQDATGNIWKIAQQNSQAGMDAIQEVAIQTSNYAAEFGQAAGGYFDYTMKSGTNAFHGSAYDYLVNEALNAGLPFTDRCVNDGKYCTSIDSRQHVRNRVRRSDYGFTVGGPVKLPKLYNGSNRTFFFANFEQYRDNRFTSSGLFTVPTTAYRNGNFGTALCSFYSGGNTDGLGGTCNAFNPITQGCCAALRDRNLQRLQSDHAGRRSSNRSSRHEARAGHDLRSVQHSPGERTAGPHPVPEQHHSRDLDGSGGGGGSEVDPSGEFARLGEQLRGPRLQELYAHHEFLDEVRPKHQLDD